MTAPFDSCPISSLKIDAVFRGKLSSSANLEISAVAENEKPMRKDERRKDLEVICHSGLNNFCNMIVLWIILLFPVDRDTHEIFYRLQSNVSDAASLFQTSQWYIEMHHVRTFFSVWRHGFFALRDVHSQRVYLQEESSPCFFNAIELSAWPLFLT